MAHLDVIYPALGLSLQEAQPHAQDLGCRDILIVGGEYTNKRTVVSTNLGDLAVFPLAKGFVPIAAGGSRNLVRPKGKGNSSNEDRRGERVQHGGDFISTRTSSSNGSICITPRCQCPKRTEAPIKINIACGLKEKYIYFFPVFSILFASPPLLGFGWARG